MCTHTSLAQCILYPHTCIRAWSHTANTTQAHAWTCTHTHTCTLHKSDLNTHWENPVFYTIMTLPISRQISNNWASSLSLLTELFTQCGHCFVWNSLHLKWINWFCNIYPCTVTPKNRVLLLFFNVRKPNTCLHGWKGEEILETPVFPFLCFVTISLDTLAWLEF